MSLRKGDRVEVLSKMRKNGWIWGKIEGVGEGYIPETFLGEKKPEEGPDPKEKLSIVLRAAKILAGSSERSITLTSMIEKYEKIVSSISKLLEEVLQDEKQEKVYRGIS